MRLWTVFSIVLISAFIVVAYAGRAPAPVGALQAVHGGDLLDCYCIDSLSDKVDKAMKRVLCDQDADALEYKAGTVRPANPADSDLICACPPEKILMLCVGHPGRL